MVTTEFRKAQRDLQERTFCFAKDIRSFVRDLSRSMANIEDGKQLIRSSGSIGANYLEASEAMSKKDAIRILKICRKESKESHYWLQLVNTDNQPALEQRRCALASEAQQFLFIFSSIVSKLTSTAAQTKEP
ncbi:MAG: four helix bundle protein [Candidatus Peribacter sp.]|nr:four helix bundle protein [Candidatus Peribacter sp.]